MTRGKAIRAKCIDCCGGQRAEVRKCVSVDCPLHRYRMGSELTPENSVAETVRSATGRPVEIRVPD